MATPVQAVNEPEYGAIQQQQQNEEAQAITQAQGDAQDMAVAQAAQPPQPEQQEAPAQSGPGYTTIKNPYMLLPPTVNFPQQNPQKTPVERNYDAGLLFEVMGNSSLVFRAAAKELLGK